MKKQPQIDPEKHKAIVLVMEAIAMALMVAGAPKQEAIIGASMLFDAAHREALNFELENMLDE